MINGKKIIVVLPAYNAAKTLIKTYNDIPKNYVDEIILVDDCSKDETIKVANDLGLNVIRHPMNLGYGGNQKTCYTQALKRSADIIVMLHPDYQYPPQLVLPMASLIASGVFDVVLGSRILGGNALKGGMPVYKYFSNRFLTATQNFIMGQKLSEYHTGYRAFSRQVLLQLPLLENSNDFVFDNQMLAQVFHFGFKVGEISSPCLYNEDASSISFRRSTVYGLEVLKTSLQYFLHNENLALFPIFNPKGRRLESA